MFFPFAVSSFVDHSFYRIHTTTFSHVPPRCHSHSTLSLSLSLLVYIYIYICLSYQCFTLALLCPIPIGFPLSVLSHLFILFLFALITAPVSLGTWYFSSPEAVQRLAQNEPRMCSPISSRPSDTDRFSLPFLLLPHRSFVLSLSLVVAPLPLLISMLESKQNYRSSDGVKFPITVNLRYNHNIVIFLNYLFNRNIFFIYLYI